MNFCSDSVSGKYIKVRILLFPIASFVFAEIHIQYFFSVRYRKSNELKSRALLNRHWHLMYLHISLIQCCRYLCGNRCIYKALIFIVADALFGINVSATCFSSNLQILLSLPVMYNCICILPFLGFKDTPFANFASTSHIFDNVKMLPSKITHLQLAFSMLCGCSPSKFCIFNPLESTIADIVARYPLSSIYFTT